MQRDISLWTERRTTEQQNNSERLKINEGKPPKIETGTIQPAPTVALGYISKKQELGTAAARLP